jgi:soluble lytic murein transglycosylase
VNLVYADELPLAQRFSQGILNPSGVGADELFLRAFVHDYATIQNLFFSRIPVADRNTFTAKYARLFYPQPYRDLVDGAVQRNPRMDKEYVYSIMRQESGFNALSHSWANAYGLLQLLPKVARDTMAKAGVTFTEDYELYRAEVNIPIGVAHMDDLIDRAGAPFIMRTSAYNATVEKTIEWRQRLYTGNVYEFIEEIPYDETRSYIRLVMRNYIMNLRLNATAPFPFPEHLLDL